jgi:imidazolonepropionase-like amidohydrolase
MKAANLVKLLMFFLLALTGCVKEPIPQTESVTAFVGVDLIAMEGDTILENQTVLVKGARIHKLGPEGEISIPRQAVRIDGKGRYLMPGLVDMHFHNERENDFVLCLANGITTIRNMWGDSKHLEWRRRIESGELLGPTIITAGPLLDGSPPIWEGSAVIETVEQARKAVSAQKRAGYDFIKIYDNLSLEVFDAIMDEAKKQGIPVAGHVPFDVDMRHAWSSGLASNEHLTGYMDLIQADVFPGKGKKDPVSRLRQWMYLDEHKIPEVLAHYRDSAFWNCVTLVVYQGLISPDESREYFKRPEMKYLDPFTKAFWDPANDPRWDELNEDDFEQRRRMDGVLKKLTGALHNETGRILLGTDCQNGMVLPGFSIHRELQNLVDAGLTPYEAIKAGTSAAAECLGVDTFGTLTPGKRADLVLLDDNPLEDVSNARKIVGVMVRGRWLVRDELQRMLEDVASSFIPPENRFAEVPPLSVDETVLFSGRFEMRYAGIPMGEERLSIERLSKGRKRIQAQAVTDYPYSSIATLNMAVDDAGECISLQYSHRAATGARQIEMVQSEGKLKISGRVSSEEQIDLEEETSGNLYLGASMLSNLVPAVDMARALHVGEKLQLRGKAIRVLPFWFVSSIADETIIIRRKRGDPESTSQAVGPTTIYEMEVTSNSFPHKSLIFLDSNGDLLELHVLNQQGTIKFIRVE